MFSTSIYWKRSIFTFVVLFQRRSNSTYLSNNSLKNVWIILKLYRDIYHMRERGRGALPHFQWGVQHVMTQSDLRFCKYEGSKRSKNNEKGGHQDWKSKKFSSTSTNASKVSNDWFWWKLYQLLVQLSLELNMIGANWFLLQKKGPVRSSSLTPYKCGRPKNIKCYYLKN